MMPRRLFATPLASWLLVLLWCGVSVATGSAAMIASAGFVIALWSIGLAQNLFGMMDALVERGRTRPVFDMPRSSYRAIGWLGVLIGLTLAVLSILRVVAH
jgi:hypothetical protein